MTEEELIEVCKKFCRTAGGTILFGLEFCKICSLYGLEAEKVKQRIQEEEE